MRDLELKFKSIVGGENIMTPEVVGYFERGSYIIELSTSSSCFCGLHFYGVTIADTKTKKHRKELCRSFGEYSKQLAYEKALDYINSLT